MARDDDNRKRPFRPRRDRDDSPEAAKERIEKEFSREIEMRVTYFLNSDEQELALEPMNSYRRMVVHTVAKKNGLGTESRGEDRDRHVCLLKTSETPKAAAPGKVRLWDFGSQSFPVKPGENGIHMALKVDGSLEIWQEREKKNIIADRIIHDSEFRIRKGKILVPGEAGY